MRFKIIIWFFVVLLVIFFVANIFVGIYAPRIIEQQIQQHLGLNASLRKVSLSLPFSINLENLEIANLASIKKISLSPNLIALLFGKIVIHGLNIVEPVINLEQSTEGKLNLPSFDSDQKPHAIYVTSLKVENGKIIFMDKKVTSDGFRVIANKLNVKVDKVLLPVTSLAVNFKISTELLNARGEFFGSLVFDGWLDYLAKDIDAQLEIKNMDVANFSPYYGNFISNKKLSRAMLDLNSNFKAENNALEIATDLYLSKLVYEQSQEVQPELELMKNTLDLFTDANGNLKLEFTINTKLDNPALSQEQLKKIILKAAMKNLANQSPQQLVNKVADALEKYKDIGKELKNIFGKD